MGGNEGLEWLLLTHFGWSPDWPLCPPLSPIVPIAPHCSHCPSTISDTEPCEVAPPSAAHPSTLLAWETFLGPLGHCPPWTAPYTEPLSRVPLASLCWAPQPVPMGLSITDIFPESLLKIPLPRPSIHCCPHLRLTHFCSELRDPGSRPERCRHYWVLTRLWNPSDCLSTSLTSVSTPVHLVPSPIHPIYPYSPLCLPAHPPSLLAPRPCHSCCLPQSTVPSSRVDPECGLSEWLR